MKVNPRTETEVQEAGLLAAGEYDFEVLEASEGQSSKGNDMITLKLSVLDEDENTHIIFDYIVMTDQWAFKQRHFADSVSLLPEYERGEIPVDRLPGRAGRAKLIIQPAKGEYAAKNSVKDYIVRDGETAITRQPTPKTSNKEELSDDIPF